MVEQKKKKRKKRRRREGCRKKAIGRSGGLPKRKRSIADRIRGGRLVGQEGLSQLKSKDQNR
jgi:hypothetical protein